MRAKRVEDQTMISIARSIEVYNQAYRLAWPYVSDNKSRSPDVSKLLGDAIQRRIRVGETDPVKVATEAVTELDEKYRIQSLPRTMPKCLSRQP